MRTSVLSRLTNRFATYYYRVRGINSYGAGEWSATVSPQFQGYSDDFSDVNSGWPRKVYYHRVDNKDVAVFDVSYENGSYRAKIMLDTRSFNNYSMGTVRAPWVNEMSEYEVQVDHRFARADDQVTSPTSGKGGLIFGANGDYSTIFVVEWNYEGDCAVTRYENLGSTVVDVRFADHHFHKSWGRCSSLSTGYDKHNLIKVVVDGNQATVTINGSHIDTFTDSGLSSARRVGLMAGSWERTPVENRFDDFSVIAR